MPTAAELKEKQSQPALERSCRLSIPIISRSIPKRSSIGVNLQIVELEEPQSDQAVSRTQRRGPSRAQAPTLEGEQESRSSLQQRIVLRDDFFSIQ